MKRRITSLILALVMLCSLCPTVFADEGASKGQYRNYVLIGDSIAAGHSLPEYQASPNACGDGKKIAGSYAQIITDALGTNTYYEARQGMRTDELRMLLDDSYQGDALTRNVMPVATSQSGKYDISLYQNQALKTKFRKEIKNADLITIELGSNDLMLCVLGCMFQEMGLLNEDVFSASSEPAMVALAEETKLMQEEGDSSDDIAKKFQEMDKAEFVRMVVRAVREGKADFKENWDFCISKIRQMNPTATIVAVGLYNPVKGMTLTDKSLLPIGNLLDSGIREMNRFIQKESACKDQYVYADIFDTELNGKITISNMAELGMDLIHNVHPSMNGHAYIASQILNVLPDVEKLPYTDVADNHWAYEDIYYCWSQNVMRGKTDTRFRPNGTVTRGEFINMLYRSVAGSPRTGSNEPFIDVSNSNSYRQAIIWAWENGIDTGSGKLFGPGLLITEKKAAQILYNFAKVYCGAAGGQELTTWAAQNGVKTGNPKWLSVTLLDRAHCAALLGSFDKNVVK